MLASSADVESISDTFRHWPGMLILIIDAVTQVDA